MRVRSIRPVLLVVVTAFLMTSAALANSVNLTYKGHGMPNHQGYPYLVSINGSSTLTPLICDAFDNDVHVGESWTATATPFLQGIANSMFGPSMTLDYKAAGLIFKSILDGSVSSAAGQWAIWGLFSANAQNNPLYNKTGGSAIAAQYLVIAATAQNSAFNGLILYTPLNGKPGSGPQEFIGYSAVPEPGSLILFGTGLLGLATALRKKYAKS